MSAVNNYSRMKAAKFGLTRLANAKTRNGFAVYYKKGLFGKTYYRLGSERAIRLNKKNIVRKAPNRNQNRNNNKYVPLNERNLQHIN